MSLLSPLYLLGLAAIGLPILLHLVRQKSQQRIPFSAVQFLPAAPARLDRRRHLEHWLLLAMRAAVLALLAIAFARPVLRTVSAVPGGETRPELVCVLLDTSASMHREDFWQQTLTAVESVVKSAKPRDVVSVATFDSAVRLVLPLSEADGLTSSQRWDRVQARLGESVPGWNATHLAEALLSVADRLTTFRPREGDASEYVRKVIVISDLQSGSRLTELAQQAWPDDVLVELQPVQTSHPTNASVQIVESSGWSAGSAEPIRVRVTNSSDAQRTRFQLWWADIAPTDAAAEAVTIVVPPGEVRMASLPSLPESVVSAQLVLEGDDREFDNHAYLTAFVPEAVTVGIFGSDLPDDPNGLLYFLQRAFPPSYRRNVTVSSNALELHSETIPANRSGGVLGPNGLVILGSDAWNFADRMTVQSWLQAGGTVLLPLSSEVKLADVMALVGKSASSEMVHPEEVIEVDQPVIFSEIDFSHRLLSAFTEARFADFTRIQVWRHRRVSPEMFPGARVLASFDDGDAALVEIPVGQGRLHLWTTTWSRDDSQLALSSKFVPILDRLLDSARQNTDSARSFAVGERIPLPRGWGSLDHAVVAGPSGEEVDVDAGDSGGSASFVADRPGVYTLASRGGSTAGPRTRYWAVNLAAEEGRTGPLDRSVLQTAGVSLAGGQETVAADKAAGRQRHLAELEQEQKLWRWCLLSALLLIIFETAYARMAGRRRNHAVAQQISIESPVALQDATR